MAAVSCAQTTVTFQPRSERVAVPGAFAELARTYAEIVNVSRTGALIRGSQRHAPGDEWPVLLELGRAPLVVLARVVRCEPVAAASGRRGHALGLAFVNPSAEAVALLDCVCHGVPPRRKEWVCAQPRRRERNEPAVPVHGVPLSVPRVAHRVHPLRAVAARHASTSRR